jgi:hypothetical protein
MSEPTDKKEPEDVTVDETIANWKKPLEKDFHVALTHEESEKVTPEQYFNHFDSSIGEELKKTKENPEMREYFEQELVDIKNNKTGASNNFFFLFYPEGAEQALEGKNFYGSYGMKPFYINQRSSGAWSRMCELFPNEATKAIKFTQRRKVRFAEMSEEESSALNKLALYLIEQEGVEQLFLTK